MWAGAKATVEETDITADHNTNLVDSRIILCARPELRFGKFGICGNKRLDPRRLRKMTGYPRASASTPRKWTMMRKRLRCTGIFSAITVSEAGSSRTPTARWTWTCWWSRKAAPSGRRL